MSRKHSLCSDGSSPHENRWQLLKEFWQAIDEDLDIGRTHWEDLVRIRDAVTECRDRGDLASAESLTAQAMHLIDGAHEMY